MPHYSSLWINIFRNVRWIITDKTFRTNNKITKYIYIYIKTRWHKKKVDKNQIWQKQVISLISTVCTDKLLSQIILLLRSLLLLTISSSSSLFTYKKLVTELQKWKYFIFTILFSVSVEHNIRWSNEHTFYFSKGVFKLIFTMVSHYSRPKKCPKKCISSILKSAYKHIKRFPSFEFCSFSILLICPA